jgi:hypothetical protein
MYDHGTMVSDLLLRLKQTWPNSNKLKHSQMLTHPSFSQLFVYRLDESTPVIAAQCLSLLSRKMVSKAATHWTLRELLEPVGNKSP